MKTVGRFLLVMFVVSMTFGNAVAVEKKKSAKPKIPAEVKTPLGETASEDATVKGEEEVDETDEDTDEDIKLKRIPLDMVFTQDGMVESDEPNAAVGLDIFLKKCSACHSVTKQEKSKKRKKKKNGIKEIAPTLLNVTKRHSEDWLIRWLTDPQITWEDEEDQETNELKQRVLERGVSRPETRMKLRMKPKDIPHMLAYLNTVIKEEKEPEKELENAQKKKGSKKSKKKKK